MKVIGCLVLMLAVLQLNADTIVLNDGEKVECEILTARADTLVTISVGTGELHKFAFEDIMRIERTQFITRRDRSIEYGFFGGIIGALTALSLKELADLDDSKIIAPLYTICVSAGIMIGVQTVNP